MDSKNKSDILFSAHITPNRSLTRNGYVLFMGFFIVYCLGLGVFFLTMGWWPIFVFLGLDLIALWWAFKITYKQGRRLETISITKNTIVIEKINPNGHSWTCEYNPTWTRLAFQKGMEEHQLDALFLRHKNDQCEIAADLSHSEKFDFYNALKLALSPISQLSPIELEPHRILR